MGLSAVVAWLLSKRLFELSRAKAAIFLSFAALGVT